MKFSLKVKFALGSMVFIFFIVFSFMSFFIATYRKVLESKLEEKGVALTKTLTGNSQSEYFLWLKNKRKLSGILKGVIKKEISFECCTKEKKEQDVVYSAFFDEKKNLIAKRSLIGIDFKPVEIVPFLKEKGIFFSKIIRKKGEKFLLISMPVYAFISESQIDDIVFV